MTRGLADDRGAITVIALFLAIFAIAILYTVVGTAEVILARERLQDAADSSALSSAVMHARSMNLLVLINLVMAALLAVLVTIKLVETLAIIAIAIAGALAWITAGATLAAVPPLHAVRQTMHSTYDNVKDPVYQALEALHHVSDTVADVAPGAAEAVAKGELARAGEPVVSGAVLGTRGTLPVSDGKFDELCKEAGGMPAMLAKTGLESAGIPVLPQLMGALESPMKSLAGEFSDWFCGDSDGGGGPRHRQKIKQSYPQLETPASLACAEGKDLQGFGGPPRNVTSRACEESLAEEEAGNADAQTGGCPAGRDCSLDGPYERRVQEAREQCDPLLSPRPFAYWYQTREGTVLYQWTGAFWKRGQPSYARLARHGGDPSQDAGEPAPPCGPDNVGPSVAVGYRRRAHPGSDVRDINPVCSTEEAPELPKLAPARGTEVPVTFTEVTHILGCRREIEKDIRVETGESAKRDGSSKSPKLLLGTARLGDENFQIRALVQGNSGGEAAAGIVRLALWNAKEPDSSAGALERFGRFSVAGAEYFYDGDEEDKRDRAAWMWNMKWRARLRRFHLPEGTARSALSKGCGGLVASEVCASIFELGDSPRSMFLH